MVMPSNGYIFLIAGLCKGNQPVTGGFPSQRPVTRSFGVFFDVRPNQMAKETVETLVIWDAVALSMTQL